MAQAYDPSIVQLSFRNGFAIIHMNNGENRFNLNFINALNAALDKVDRNQSCKALITTGTGKFFSNGFDLGWMSQQDRETTMRNFQGFNKIVERILLQPIPTIAAVNGHAYAAGCLLALAHDFRVMRKDRGWICMNEIHIKLVVQTKMMNLLKLKIPPGPVLRDIILYGRSYTAEEGFRIGIVDEVVEESEVIPKAMELANKYLTKQGLDRTTLRGLKGELFSDFWAVKSKL